MASVLEEADRLPEADEQTEPERGVSVLDALRAKREELERTIPEPLDLDVPGYDGRLVIRYHYPETGAAPLIAAARRVATSNDPNASLDAACDTLIASCAEVLGRDGGNIVPLDPSRDEQHPLRLGKPLADLLGIAVPEGIRSPARYVVRALFSPRGPSAGLWDGDLALMQQAGEVTVWLNSAGSRIAEEFSGEA